MNNVLYIGSVTQQRDHPAARAYLDRKDRRWQDATRRPPRPQAPPRQPRYPPHVVPDE